MNIMNCPRCGKIYAQNMRNLCVACIKLSDEECDRCNKYLKENRTAVIEELSKATDVETAQIMRFIREGRISIAKNPNISFSCESCGTAIREGNLCASCRKRFVNSFNEMKQTQAQQLQQQVNNDQSTYKTRQDKNER
jgi:flagellar operon protein (TIGR03826 family)